VDHIGGTIGRAVVYDEDLEVALLAQNARQGFREAIGPIESANDYGDERHADLPVAFIERGGRED
jgi:hypothetical protein